MLHMVVNTHGAETCAFRSDENREPMIGAFRALSAAATAHGGKMEGAWVNLSAHTAFLLIDAPNGHVVDEIIREAGLIGHTTTNIFAVNVLAEAIEQVT
jgi:hypothetical protein